MNKYNNKIWPRMVILHNFQIFTDTYKVRNEIETKRNEINENETKRNEINEMKRNQRKFKKSNYLLFLSLFRFVFYFFPSIFFISVYFVLLSLVSFHFVDFVSFRFVFVDFVSFRFYFVSHFIGIRKYLVIM
jgi:hypothetical protein